MLWEGSLGDSKGEYLYKIFSGSEETFKNIFPKFGIKVSEVPLDSKARFFNFRQDTDLVKFLAIESFTKATCGRRTLP